MDRILYLLPDACAVSENGRLVEYLRTDGDSQSGDIIMARVNRIMPGLDCAFVDIARKKEGFLPLNENSRTFTEPPVRSGDRIPVQIRKEEHGDKGCFLSRDLAIAGEYVILMPYNRFAGVSKRIQDEETRCMLTEIGREIACKMNLGVVMRAASEKVSVQMISEEAEKLKKCWNKIRGKSAEGPAPGTVLYSCDPAEQILQDYRIRDTGKILKADKLETDLQRQLKSAGERRIQLQCGGNIVIDQCEAMTVIDVNTASTNGCGSKEGTVTAVNLEACGEAAIQIRLRDITGIILIDFVDMEKETDRILVEERIRNAFSEDRRKTVIHGWTRLGIMEMTRKRV